MSASVIFARHAWQRPGSQTADRQTPQHRFLRFDGEELAIGFNHEFFRDGLEAIKEDEVLLRLISPLRPGLLQPVDGDDFRYLVMPIRLNE